MTGQDKKADNWSNNVILDYLIDERTKEISDILKENAEAFSRMMCISGDAENIKLVF